MSSSLLQQELTGLVSCPILRNLICPIRRATGVFAHTKSYCSLMSVEELTTMGKFSRLWKALVSSIPPGPGEQLHRQHPPSSGGLQPAQDPYQLQEQTSHLQAQHQQYIKYYR